MKGLKELFGFRYIVPFDKEFKKLPNNLPLHHIDGAIFMEEPNTNKGKDCAKYFRKCGLKFRAKISIIALGEMLTKALSLENDQMIAFFTHVKTLIETGKIGVYNINDPITVTKNLNDIEENDKFIDKVDKLILACALSDSEDVKNLITYDGSLKKYNGGCNIRINSPDELDL